MRALVALILLAPAAAAAYPTGFQFDQDAVTSDGAGLVAFTGAPRWAGHTCDVCHTDPPRRIGLRLEANPVDIFATGYIPGATYQLRVVLLGEWAGLDAAAAKDACGLATNPYQKCDDNGFAIEIDDGDGVPRGTLSAAAADGSCGAPPVPDADAYVLMDGSAAVQNGAHHAQTGWNLCWTAPMAGTGGLTAYLAAVDGNGGDGTKAFPNDMTGDDVFAGSVPILEKGAAAMPAQQGGCNVSPGGGAAAAALLLILALATRRRTLMAVALAAALSAGCVAVHSYQREDLAKRKMKFAADENEDELDLHMQEAREGSSGGYGSAGGGCGCN
jgi:MYXO-CTERM domain-containing protein